MTTSHNHSTTGRRASRPEGACPRCDELRAQIRAMQAERDERRTAIENEMSTTS